MDALDATSTGVEVSHIADVSYSEGPKGLHSTPCIVFPGLLLEIRCTNILCLGLEAVDTASAFRF